MSSPYVTDSSVYADTNGIPTRLSAIDFWNYVESTGNTCGLEIYGVAKIHIEVYVQDKSIGLKLKLVSDDLRIEVQNLTELQDYVIFEGAWIPIDLIEVEEIEDLLKQNNIEDLAQISLASTLSLIAECKRRTTTIYYDQDELNRYLPIRYGPLE